MLPPPYQCVLSIKLKQIQIQIWLKRSMCVDSHSQNCLINTNIETNINNNQQIVSVVSKEYVHIKNTNVSWSTDQYNNNRLKNTKYNPGLFCLVLGTAGDKTKVMTKLQIISKLFFTIFVTFRPYHNNSNLILIQSPFIPYILYVMPIWTLSRTFSVLTSVLHQPCFWNLQTKWWLYDGNNYAMLL